MQDACERRKQRLTREALGAPSLPQHRGQRRISSAGGLLIALVAAAAVWAPLGSTVNHMARADVAMAAPLR